METNPYVLEYASFGNTLRQLYSEIGPVLEKVESIPKRFFRKCVYNGKITLKLDELKEKVGLTKKVSENMLRLEGPIFESYENWFVRLANSFEILLSDYNNSAFSFSNLYSEGVKRSLFYWGTYDPNKDAKFITYITKGFKWGVQNYVKGILRDKRKIVLKSRISFDEPVENSGGNDRLFGEIFDPKFPSIEELVMKKKSKDIFELISMLGDNGNGIFFPKRGKEVLETRYGGEDILIFKEVKNILGTTVENLRQAERGAIKKIRIYCKKHNLTIEDFI